MKTSTTPRPRRGVSLAIAALFCAMFLGGITQVSAKDKNAKNGYWDPRGNYHFYSDDKREKNARNGYWDPRGNYHYYSDDKKNDDKKNQGTDYISKGRQIWDIFN